MAAELYYLKEILNRIDNIENKKIESIKLDLRNLIDSNERIETKLDEVYLMVSNLTDRFSDLKSEIRENEEKISLMYMQLNKFEKNIESDDFDDYCELSKKVINYWDDLDELTKKFIPVAEYLFSKLQKNTKADFSPVILQYCRAIENEFLLKIFRKYTLGLIDRKGREIHTFLFSDQQNTDTKVFAGAIKKAIRSRTPEFTLGQMNTILLLSKDQSKIRNSVLLQDFIEYIKDNHDIQRLLNINYINKINEIVREYRNPSAHPEFMDIEHAQVCKSIVPENIDYLLECSIDCPIQA